MERARAKLQGAAETLAQPGAAATVSVSAEGRSRAGDVPGALVDLMSARHEMAANVAVLRAEDEMMREMVDMGRKEDG
jgi:hypothetical protein